MMFKKSKKKANTKRFRIMLVCGSGIVSSTLVHPMVEDILQNNNYNYEIIKGGFNDIKGKTNIDLILTTMAEFPQEIKDMGIPIVVVTSLFKGDTAGVEKEINKILKSKEE